MNLSMKTKVIVAVAVFAIVVAGACAWRAWDDSRKDAATEAKAAQAGQMVDVAGFNVSKLAQGAIDAVGGEEAYEALEAQIAVWCRQNVKDCNTATWNSRMRVDFKAGSVELGYTLDDESKTKITVTVWPDTKRCTVVKGASV